MLESIVEFLEALALRIERMRDNDRPVFIEIGKAIRVYAPHAIERDFKFRGKVRQIAGGRRWSLCLITRIVEDK